MQHNTESFDNIERMKWVMKVCDIESREELLNTSITFLEWAAKEVMAGNKIAAFDLRNNSRSIPNMKIFENIRKLVGKGIKNEETDR